MFTVDTTGIIGLADKLTLLHRAVIPNAIRSTLNDMAFDVKKNRLIPELKDSDMVIRAESFFKKYSGVQKAEGWDPRKMVAQVGMIPSGDATKAVSRLEQQEEGGELGDRSFVPDVKARTGARLRGKVRSSAYHGKMKLVDHVAWGDKQGLIRAVTRSKVERGGTGQGNVIIYGNVLYEIQGFKRLRKLDSIKLHLKKLYTFKKDRVVRLKPQRFMQKSAVKSGANMQEVFMVNLNKQLLKFAGR